MNHPFGGLWRCQAEVEEQVNAMKRFKGFSELTGKMPYVSSTLMILIGLFVAGQSLTNLLH